VNRALAVLILAVVLLLSLYFALAVYSNVNAAARPRAATFTPFLAPIKPLPCVACVSLMAPPGQALDGTQ
jgi:hypothetical protein